MTLVDTKIKVDLEDIAYMIKNLSKSELETLELMLSGQAKVLKKRYDDIKKGRVKTLSEAEVFKDV